MANEVKVVCFDVDGTNGEFTRVHMNTMGHLPYKKDPQNGIRYGMPELLTRLKERGFLVYATSTGPDDLPSKALEAAGLRQFYNDVFNGRELDWGKGHGKDYDVAVLDAGLKINEKSDNVIVVGDTPNDFPADSQQIVFIYDPEVTETHMHDAVMFEKIIFGLLVEGEGSFLRGFENLHGEPQDTQSLSDQEKYNGQIVEIDGIRCRLFYAFYLDRALQRRDRKGFSRQPVVEILRNDEYMRELVPF